MMSKRLRSTTKRSRSRRRRMTKRKRSGGKPLPINVFEQLQPHYLAQASPEQQEYYVNNSRDLNRAAPRPTNWSSPTSWFNTQKKNNERLALRRQELGKFARMYNAEYAQQIRNLYAALPAS